MAKGSIAVLVVFSVVGSIRPDHGCPTAGAHHRWGVKTSAVEGPITNVSLQDLQRLSWPAPAVCSQLHVSAYSARWTGSVKSVSGPELHEGQLIRTTGWLHLINHDDLDDDYHIQLRANPNSCTQGCAIVEIPMDTCAEQHDEATRWHFLANRA